MHYLRKPILLFWLRLIVLGLLNRKFIWLHTVRFMNLKIRLLAIFKSYFPRLFYTPRLKLNGSMKGIFVVFIRMSPIDIQGSTNDRSGSKIIVFTGDIKNHSKIRFIRWDVNVMKSNNSLQLFIG